MSRRRLIGSSRWSGRLGLSCVVVCAAMLYAFPAAAWADTIALRFNGTADLTGFGGSPTSVFAGSVTWDPSGGWVPVWPGCPDFCLDGSPGAVTATLVIDSVDYVEQIDPISRLIVWGFGGMSLDLHFSPAIDFDGGIAPDVLVVSLNMFSDPSDYSLLVDGQLPYDLAFLPHLNDRYLVFSDTFFGGVCEEPCVRASTLSVVPEPSSTALLLVGLLVGARSVGRGRRPLTDWPRSDPRTDQAAGHEPVVLDLRLGAGLGPRAGRTR